MTTIGAGAMMRSTSGVSARDVDTGVTTSGSLGKPRDNVIVQIVIFDSLEPQRKNSAGARLLLAAAFDAFPQFVTRLLKRVVAIRRLRPGMLNLFRDIATTDRPWPLAPSATAPIHAGH